MNKIVAVALLSFFSQLVSAQVGIGNTNPKAQLDITASNAATPTAEDGILIPRINNFPAINPTAPQNGMLVFLTTTSGLNLPGFYYWSNPTSTWVGISNNNKSWDTTGNSVAVSGTHFVGTTTTQDLDFRTNNIIRMRLSQKGQLEFLNNGRSVFIGDQAGENDDLTNNENVFVGYRSGFGNTSGLYNSAVGSQSLLSNSTGVNNSAFGFSALVSNTTGNNNTGIGTNALMANLTGGSNTAVGTNALLVNTTGSANIAVGKNSLISNTNGYNNTAIGATALRDNTSGYDNVSIGGSSLLSNTTGFFNTAIGFTALLTNTTGVGNTGMGTSALYNNSTGSNNTAVGVSSLLSNDTGANNSGFGNYALRDNTIGKQNTASGRSCLEGNISGNLNTAEGYFALNNNVSGSGNVSTGANSMILNVAGNNNTAVGTNAGTASAVQNNATAIGSLAIVNLSDKIRLGSVATTLIEGQVSFSNPSDARFKNNIKNNVPGLDFIMKLKPVTYNFDTKKFDEHLMQNLPDSIKSKNITLQDYSKYTSIIHSGFLAQDIEKAAKEISYDFDGLHVPDPTNPTDNYSVAYSQFIMPIVKSIQEQQQTIVYQKSEINKLTSENALLKAELEKQKQLLKAIDQRLGNLEKRN